MSRAADQYSGPEDRDNILLATFQVRGAMCALDAAGIREVIRLGTITRVPHAPAEVVGIVNLRGKIVTVLDIGLMLGFPAVTPDEHSRVIILSDQDEFMGLLVDRVNEVVELEAECSQPLPANMPPAQAGYFSGACRLGDRVIAILDPAAVLSPCTH